MLHSHTESTNQLIDDKNLSDFASYTTEQGLQDALKIYQSTFAGDLATIIRPGRELSGYPMGSVAPFMLDHTGCPVIFSARIAEHSKNAKNNSRASLLVRDISCNHRIETGWRLTIVGDLEEVTADERERVAKQYERFYPNSASYSKVHDFMFLRLRPKKLRLIKTFGQIKWLNVEEVAVASPFTEAQEDHIIGHMNEDHAAAIQHYMKVLNIENAATITPVMVGVNQFGATLRYGQHLVQLPFTEVSMTTEAVRKQLVALAKR